MTTTPHEGLLSMTESERAHHVVAWISESELEKLKLRQSATVMPSQDRDDFQRPLVFAATPSPAPRLEVAELIGEIEDIEAEFPNYASWVIELPAGHWRAVRAALAAPASEGGR